jgi:hypothetical protein
LKKFPPVGLIGLTQMFLVMAALLSINSHSSQLVPRRKCYSDLCSDSVIVDGVFTADESNC